MDVRVVVGICPTCGAEVFERSSCFYCSAYKTNNCDFTLWKDTLRNFKRPNIDISEMRHLLADKTIVLHLKSPKKGTAFACRGKLIKNNEYNRWNIELIFPQKKERQEIEAREMEA